MYREYAVLKEKLYFYISVETVKSLALIFGRALF